MDSTLLTIGNFEVKWYSVLLLVSFSLGYLIMAKEAKRFKISSDFIFNMLFWTIIFSLIGSRTYYVVFNFDYFKDNINEIFKVWHGGLAIHGGIIAGALTIYLYTKKHKIRTLKLFDIAAVSLILGQAIGRWGNFFNGEAHGVATTLKHLKDLHIPSFIIDKMYIGGIYYTPTFLYESLWCLSGFLILLFLRRRKLIKVGNLTGVYLMWYSTGRFFIEASRTDSLMFLGFKIAQIVSVILFTVGLILIIRNFRKEKFEDLYNEASSISEE